MRMKTKLIIILLGSFVVAGAVYGVASRPRRIVPTTVRGNVTEYDAAGNIISTEEYVRYQSASGDWRIVKTRGDKVTEQFFAQGRGVFSVDRARGRLVRDGLATERVSTD